MYERLHRKYYTTKRILLRLITLRTLAEVHFARFRPYWSKNVAILNDNLEQLPPVGSQEYEYEPSSVEGNRPLLSTELKHFIQYPSHASATSRYHMDRIPKKLSSKLRFSPDNPIQQDGLGLRLSERISWTLVWIVEAAIGLLGIAVAVAMRLYWKADIQSSCTAAGLILAYGTILVGLMHGVAQWFDRH